MVSIKVKYRPSSVEAEKGTVYYQVIRNRVSRRIATGYRINSDEWDCKRSTVTTTRTSPRCQLVLSIRDCIRWDLDRLRKISERLTHTSIDFTSEDVVDEFKRYRCQYTFLNYMEAAIASQKRKGRETTAINYRSALNSFKRFVGEAKQQGRMRADDELMLDCLTSDTMEQYEAWQKERGICPNTISFYMRIFRAVYRRAVEDEVIEDRHPFRHVYTGVDKTVKRALSLALIRKIKGLDLSQNPRLDYTRDMFMLSFYLRGMSFVDMAYLKKTDLRNGEVTYRRRKTSQQLKIAWTKEMQQILDKYPENESDYLLPIIRKKGINDRCTYKNVGHCVNRNLKEIGMLVGASDSQSWSFYRARHSWASAAKAKGIPLSVISEGMGHDNEATTQIYLASLDTSVVDQANDIIIASLQ